MKSEMAGTQKTPFCHKAELIPHTKFSYGVSIRIYNAFNNLVYLSHEDLRVKPPAYSNSQEHGDHKYVRGFTLRGVF